MGTGEHSEITVTANDTENGFEVFTITCKKGTGTAGQFRAFAEFLHAVYPSTVLDTVNALLVAYFRYAQQELSFDRMLDIEHLLQFLSTLTDEQWQNAIQRKPPTNDRDRKAPERRDRERPGERL
jgi:hypothetical protein